MSSANAGLSFNIIGITRNRETTKEYCQIMINPEILEYSGPVVKSQSNCGSLTLDEPIEIQLPSNVKVRYYDESGKEHVKKFDREHCSLTVQHEIDHNNGILITDRQ